MTLYNDDSFNTFKVLDACFRIAGTGSLGFSRYLFLLETETDKKRYWLLDMKRSRQSSLDHYLEVKQSTWTSEAERVINIKVMMQDVPEALLTATFFNGESFIIQEMQPTEDKVEFHQVKNDFNHVYPVMADMGVLTASAQLRSSGMKCSAIADELIAFGKDDQWQSDILIYSKEYANHVKNDYEQYLADYNNGFFE